MQKRLVLTGLIAFLILGISSLFFFNFLHLTGFSIVSIASSQTANYYDGFLINGGTPTNGLNYLRVGEPSSVYYRAYIDFNTSSIPAGVNINSVNLSLTIDTVGAVSFMIYSLNQTAASLSGSNPALLNSLCGGGAGANLTNGGIDVSSLAVGQNINISLNVNATSDLKNYLSQQFFTICMKIVTESVSAGEVRFNSSESMGGNPMLYVDYSVPADTTAPVVTIVNPTNRTYGISDFPLVFNVSLNEQGNVSYSLDNGAHNFSMTGNASNTGFNASNSSMADGSYVFRVYANDSANNMNNTENVTFSVDRTAPIVSILSPSATTYTTDSYLVNVSLNEAGNCNYSLNSGVTNQSLTGNASNTGFNASVSGVANGNYVLWAYCNDNGGNGNYSQNVSFVINVPAPPAGGGGGGGGGGSSTTPVVVDNSTCQDECSPGNSCSGNSVLTCALVNGCYKTLSIVACGSGELCAEGICKLQNGSIEEKNNSVPITTSQDTNNAEGIGRYVPSFGGIVSGLGNIPRPSDFIRIAGVPPVVVDSVAGSTGVAATGGAVWWIWVLIASSSLPFFLLKLRHYSVSIFDSGNRLKMFNKGKLDRNQLYGFLSRLEGNYGALVFASGHENVLQYMVPGGFIEIRTDEPFIISGHFTKSRDAGNFALALKKTASVSGAGNIIIFNVVERASAWGALRAWRRKRKSEAQLRKLVK